MGLLRARDADHQGRSHRHATLLKEPSTADLGGGSPWRVMKRLFLATRPLFFPASVLPVIVGTASGYRASGQLDTGALLLAAAAIMCVHAAGNVINDVYDDISGTDRINKNRIFPFTGGSRFIQNGVMSRRQMTRWGLTLLGLAAMFGTALLVIKGIGILMFGLIGTAVFLVYSVPPVHLSTRGFGEAAVGIGFGVLPVTGAAWLQAGTLSGEAFVVSIPIALWIANVLLINEVPDVDADGKSGKKTLVVILGYAGARKVYIVLNVFAVLAVAAAAAGGILPPAVVVGPAALCLATIPAARAIGPDAGSHRGLVRGIKITLAVHAVGTAWLAAWLLVA